VGPVLHRLIGGLPHKVKEQEVLEALADLRESIGRVQHFASAAEFFESGYYVDVHGYKVTMRDQLLVPEFLYLSVVLNATVHNRLEFWIRDLEGLHSEQQIRQAGSPREQITRELRAQEEEVENALGVRRRSSQHSARSDVDRAEVQASAPPRAKPKKHEKREKPGSPRFEIVWDRSMFLAIGSVIVILGVAGYLLTYTGVVGRPTIRPMTAQQMQEMSPLIARAWLVGDGDSRFLRASLFVNRWDTADGRRRREEADRILAVLAAKGVKHAEIKRNSAIAIRIADGFVVDVAGGKI
jgi:hypothetical protein